MYGGTDDADTERRSFLRSAGGAAGLAAGGGVTAAETLTTGATGETVEILRTGYGEPHVYRRSRPSASGSCGNLRFP